MSQELTAAEAAARLGVKRETLYAYVSRGLLHRHVAMDGRTSLFDADEIDSFRSDRRRKSEGELDAVVSTAITQVSDGVFRIRGRDVAAMVDDGASYEEVAELVWRGEGGDWSVPSASRQPIAAMQAAMPPSAPAIDRLRAAVLAVSSGDALRFESSPGAARAVGRAIVPAMVESLPLVGRPPAANAQIAARLWPRLTPRRATAARRRALEAALGLLVDHGLATSTFGVRVAASVRADPYALVAAGLGVVGGALHGAASSAVHRLLVDVGERGDAAAALGDVARRGEQFPGFGHLIYRTEDPRYGCLMRHVSEAWADDPRLADVHAVRDLVGRRIDAVANVDLALGALTYLAEMPEDAGEAIFAISRTAGWLAHGLEEFEESAVRFRPRARYIGER